MSLSTLNESFTKYKEFVVKNPVVVNEIESAIRWISYLTAASKYHNSHVISEFVYSAANLLQLLNDSILRKTANVYINVNATIGYLQIFLQVLEYTSVFSEFTANQFAGKLGKWIILTSIQAAKAVIKLVLLLKYKQGIQRHQQVLPMDRRSDLTCLQRDHNQKVDNSKRVADREAEIEAQIENCAELDPINNSENGVQSSTQTLKRSGRLMRTLDKAPPRSKRTWMLPTHDPRFRQMLDRSKTDAPPTLLNEQQTVGEVLHILRPVAHLAAMSKYGPQSWTPFFLSLGMDAASLKMLHEPADKIWNITESVELGQRSFALLLYLLRSPFYDNFTKERILKMLRILSDNIPLFGRLIRPLIDYLPEWQRTYFYVWGC